MPSSPLSLSTVRPSPLRFISSSHHLTDPSFSFLLQTPLPNPSPSKPSLLTLALPPRLAGLDSTGMSPPPLEPTSKLESTLLSNEESPSLPTRSLRNFTSRSLEPTGSRLMVRLFSRFPGLKQQIRRRTSFESGQTQLFYPLIWFPFHLPSPAKVAPDAFIQQVLQIAYHADQGQFSATYETASTRMFAHGRTEVIRSFSEDARALVLALEDASSSVSISPRASVFSSRLVFLTRFRIDLFRSQQLATNSSFKPARLIRLVSPSSPDPPSFSLNPPH